MQTKLIKFFLISGIGLLITGCCTNGGYNLKPFFCADGCYSFNTFRPGSCCSICGFNSNCVDRYTYDDFVLIY